MTDELILAIYAILFIVVFLAFGMQRTILLISREFEMDYEFIVLLLPKWFRIVNLLRITKFILLILISYTWGWSIALIILIIDFILTGILPIPYLAYTPIFKRQITKLKSAGNPYWKDLDKILDSIEYIKSKHR